jgi:DNA-binding GntR family transcriptional regulator
VKQAQQRKVASSLAANDAPPRRTPGPRTLGGRIPSERPLTISEQIADRVGIAIVKGEYRGGEHIPEQEIAAQFRVSHGPVREALRALERRGLVEVLPRRGAFAVEISLDAIADVFNIRGVLLGLAARNLALREDVKSASAEFVARAGELNDLAAVRTTDPLAFAHAAGRAGASVYRACGNVPLLKTLRDQSRGSLWGLMWREHTLDFLTYERRRAAAADWMAAAKAVASGNGAKAEAIVRKALFESRDGAMLTLRKLRSGEADASKFIHD